MRCALQVCAAILLATSPAVAQTIHGVVVDQTGLVLPGVRVELRRADQTRTAAVTAADGSFDLPSAGADDVIEAALDGFEPKTMRVGDAARIVLTIAHATDQAVVTASGLISSGAVMERLGSTFTPHLAQRLPAVRPRALESLPLLPSVMRGPDGLLRIDGVRPHEAALWIDGFDVSDPVTGTSPIDLPLESVKGVSVLRDPMAVTFGNILGALASLETVPGGDHVAGGVQSFIPHPRLSRSGFGRIQGFFPRAYVSGTVHGVRYLAAQEYDFERLPVPGITTRSGRPMIGEISATSFVRMDTPISKRQTITVETIFVPGHSSHAGMTPLRPASASPTVRVRDLFGGLIDRIVMSERDVITIRAGVVAHGMAFDSTGVDAALLTPGGWRGSWFTSMNHRAARESFKVNWDHTTAHHLGTHTFTLAAGVEDRSMHGGVNHHPILIGNAEAQIVRRIDFGPSGALRSTDTNSEAVARDLWEPGDRWQIDVGVRLDADRAVGNSAWSPRLGVRYRLDGSGSTVVKAGVGRFVGRLPLHALSFGAFAPRTDTTFDPLTGEPTEPCYQALASGRLRLPRADSISIEIERRLGPGLDVQVAARRRTGFGLPIVDVPSSGRPVRLESTGGSLYRELQLALRQVWNEDAQVFVSYVRSATRGELNDFTTLFADMEAPQLEHGGRSRGAADAPNRWLLWGTFAMPADVVISPATEWHTGFPYSDVDLARHYVGDPNGARFPAFFSLDLVTYKTVEIRDRKVDLGAQFFNLTRHFNPRNVMSVAGTPQYRHFTNSVGLMVSGYMMVKWQ